MMEASSQFGPGCPDSTVYSPQGLGQARLHKENIQIFAAETEQICKIFLVFDHQQSEREESMQQSTSAHRFQEFIMANDLVGANTPELKLAWAFKM